MVKEIERYGIPVVHMATITTISQSVGANRIVPTIAIPHPIGSPSSNEDTEDSIREKMVVTALLKALSTQVKTSTEFEAM